MTSQSLCELEIPDFPPSATLNNCLSASKGDWLSILGGLGQVTVLHIRCNEPLASWPSCRLQYPHKDPPVAHAWCEDNTLAVGCRHSVTIYEVTALQAKEHSPTTISIEKVVQLPLYFHVRDVSITSRKLPVRREQAPDGGTASCSQLLCVSGSNGALVFGNSGTSMQLLRTLHEGHPICCVVFSEDSSYLSVACHDRHLGIWSTAGGFSTSKDLVHISMSPADRVTSMAFSSDSSILAAACWAGTLALYKRQDSGEWVCVHTVPGAPAPVPGVTGPSLVAWSPTEPRLSFCAGGGGIVSYDARPIYDGGAQQPLTCVDQVVVKGSESSLYEKELQSFLAALGQGSLQAKEPRQRVMGIFHLFKSQSIIYFTQDRKLVEQREEVV